MANNHNYETPEPGMSDWHVPINENFEQIDRDVEIRDAEANLSEYVAKDGAKYFATDTERVFVSDGDSWTQIRSSGLNPEFSSVRTKDVNGEAYAKEFDGDGLASKVENALNWLKENTQGQGKVRVTPKPSGEPWVWDKDLSLDPTEWGGVVIDVDPNVLIEYPGSGWAITLDAAWSEQNGNFDRRAEITGGRWVATGEPTGWLYVEDCYRTLIMPRDVDFRNTTGNAVGVYVTSVDGWAESTHIDRARFDADICLDFDKGSFHGTTIKNCKFEIRGGGHGLRMRGGFDYSTIDSNSFFAKSDGATGISIGTENADSNNRIDGTTISNNKFEDPGPDAADTVAFRLAPGYNEFKQPTLINNKIYMKSKGQKVQNDSSGTRLLQMKTTEKKWLLQNLVDDSTAQIKYENLSKDFAGQAGTWENSNHGTVPIRSVTPSPNKGGGTFWIDNGTNTPDGNPGLAFLDSDGSTWYIEATKM